MFLFSLLILFGRGGHGSGSRVARLRHGSFDEVGAAKLSAVPSVVLFEDANIHDPPLDPSQPATDGSALLLSTFRSSVLSRIRAIFSVNNQQNARHREKTALLRATRIFTRKVYTKQT